MARAGIITAAKNAADAWRGTDTYHQAAQIIDMLVSELEGEPTLTPPNEWVSVEEKLPEEHADILMWRKRWKIAEAGTFHIGRFWVYDEIGDSYTADDITHWMPLPEPPKEV